MGTTLLSKNTATKSISQDDYDRAFVRERINEYSEVDSFEQRCGFRIDRDKLEDAAYTLACPLKVHDPNWQHGRVIYAALRNYLRNVNEPVRLIDIGTAKGFSALCMAFALTDHHAQGTIESIDVVNPHARTRRNSVAELEALKTVPEFVERWPESKLITFAHATGAAWLRRNMDRVHFAFVDGKHNHATVKEESTLLNERQRAGDVIVFDDLQYPGVEYAVHELQGYELDYFRAKSQRRYAVARKL